MTQELNQATGHWQVSAQGHGEVLVVRVELEGAVLVWAGPHQDADPESVGVILRAAAMFAREATRRERRSLPIPAMLYHLMSRLIAGDVPRRWPASCVAVMLGSAQELGFGLLGEAEQQVWMSGHPVQLPWVRLVQRGGGDARAYRLAADQDARVRWSWSRKDVPGEGAVIEALRQSETSMEVSSPATLVTVPAEDFSVAPVAPEPPPSSDSEPAFEPTPSFIEPDGLVDAPPAFRERRSEPMITPQLMEPEVPAAALPAPPAPPARPAPPALEAPAPAPPRRLRLEDRPPPPSPAPRGSRLFGWLDRFMGDSDKEEMPEQVPPTPEPETLTARALDPLRHEPTPAPAPTSAPEIGAGPAFVQDTGLTAPSISPEPPSIRDRSPASEPVVSRGEVDVTPDAASLPVPRRARAMPPLRPRYQDDDVDDETPAWRKPWVIGVGILVVIVAAFGLMQMIGKRSGGGMFSGSSYALAVTSDPAGAGILVDGKETPKVTPATLSLAPGKHEITLTLPGRGSAVYETEGKNGQRLTLETELYGSLNIEADDPRVPVSIAVDGVEQGYAPLTVEKLAPGPHEVRFSAPGSAPWSETFDLAVGQKQEMVARSMAEPGTGLVSVRGVVIGSDGEDDATGAEVWVDGERRGMAPLTLELSSGPHSFRSRYQGEEAPVQVLDLPGGNQRFVQFRFGLGLEMPRLTNVTPPGALPQDRPAVVSCFLTGIPETDLAEMWLHVKAPNGNWRRHAMVPMKAPGGIVGTGVFPAVMLDGHGQAPHYMSAVTRVGDEYFTEIFWQKARRRAAAPSPTSANNPAGD